MQAILDMLGYLILAVIGILIAAIPITIAVVVRSLMRIQTKKICPKCGDKVRPRRTGGKRIAGIRGEIREEYKCPSCGYTWWELA